MGKCPKCKEEINELSVTEERDGLRYTKEGFQEDLMVVDTDLYFKCPECDKTLFDREYEASKFLVED